jgi:hypothetical protein
MGFGLTLAWRRTEAATGERVADAGGNRTGTRRRFWSAQMARGHSWASL